MLSGASAEACAVLLDGAPLVLPDLDPERGSASQWWVGREGASVDADHYRVVDASLGLEAWRPLAPVHLRGAFDAADALHLAWVRRSRVDADGWLATDVPLGEEREGYEVRLFAPGASPTPELVLRADAPRLTVTAAERAAAGLGDGPLTVSIAQIGTRIGAGHPAVATVPAR